MKEVPLCNIAISSSLAANEIESLISAIKLTSAQVQKEPSRVVGVDDTTWKVSIFKQDSNNIISLKQYLCSISRVPNL